MPLDIDKFLNEYTPRDKVIFTESSGAANPAGLAEGKQAASYGSTMGAGLANQEIDAGKASRFYESLLQSDPQMAEKIKPFLDARDMDSVKLYMDLKKNRPKGMSQIINQLGRYYKDQKRVGGGPNEMYRPNQFLQWAQKSTGIGPDVGELADLDHQKGMLAPLIARFMQLQDRFTDRDIAEAKKAIPVDYGSDEIKGREWRNLFENVESNPDSSPQDIQKFKTLLGL